MDLLIIIWSGLGLVIAGVVTCDIEGPPLWDDCSRKQKILLRICMGPVTWIGYYAFKGLKMFWAALEDKPEIIGFSIDGEKPIYCSKNAAFGVLPFDCDKREIYQHTNRGEKIKITC